MKIEQQEYKDEETRAGQERRQRKQKNGRTQYTTLKDSPGQDERQHNKRKGRNNIIKAVSTLKGSQAVPDPSTNRALHRLTSEFGRDPVHSV